MQDLNSQQRQAVDHRGAVLVLAPPGSGKTRVVIARLKRILCEYDGATAIAVSFTRDSADELLLRLTNEVGAERARRVAVGTFHSLAKLQLERAGRKIALIDERERFHLLMSLGRHLRPECESDEVVALVESFKLDRASGAKTPCPYAIDVLVRIYEERLAKAGTVDFQDLLEQANAGMSAASLAPFFVHHLLIDEAQDIDALQLQWIEHHLRAGAELFAVADDDQAVYGFRRALGFKGMKRLSAASGAVSLTLTTNYRSHAELVEYSQQLISHNCYREPKDTNAARGPGGGIAYLRYPDAEAQAADIVLHVGSLEGSWGILARNRHLFYDAQAFLPSAGIRARMIGPSVWKERPVRLLFVLLAMAAGLRVRPAARDALLGWLNVCHQDLEMVHSMKLAPWGLPPANLARRKTRIASRALAELMARLPVWCELAADAGRAELAIEGAGEWLCQQLERLDKPMGRRRRDLTLVGIARSALRRMDGSFGERALSIRKFDTQDAHGAVVLSTFHGAKGLEWDNVWLLSVEAAVMPYQHASTEEERRLFYVAMTRARDRLFISSRRGVPSEFLYEAFPGHRAPIASGVLHLGERIHGAITASKAVPPVV